MKILKITENGLKKKSAVNCSPIQSQKYIPLTDSVNDYSVAIKGVDSISPVILS